MAALGSQSIASSYEQLLHVDADGGGNSTTHVSVKDGDNGTTFGFTIASDALMMSSTNRLEFGDNASYIHQSADGVLDLVSDTEIEINATTIDMNGAVDISGDTTIAGDVIMADGKGIDFAAYTDGSVAGSTTSQILKDYEEGTWVPEFRGTTGSAGASDTTVNGARYTKIGRQVFIECYVTWATIGDWTGDSRLYGLPYQASDSSTYPSLTIGYIGSVSFQSGNMIVAHVLNNNTYIRFYEVNDDAAPSDITVSSWADGDVLFLSGTYTV